MSSKGVLFASRFLESMTGANILRSPRTAIIELIANSWDAGATKVEVTWPSEELALFAVEDNGIGMTESQFEYRWRTLTYDRTAEQGSIVSVSAKGITTSRRVFGRNGVGRFAGFCFSDSYQVETWRDGESVTYRIDNDADNPVIVDQISKCPKSGSGTRVYAENVEAVDLSDDAIRSEIGTRFLSDPSFEVYVNGVRVHLGDIRQGQVEETTIDVPGVGTVQLVTVETSDTDRSTLQHGIAWHVNGRLVGDCTWRGRDKFGMIDGRKAAAKRFTFIIRADCLQSKDAILKDWTGFQENSEAFDAVASEVYPKIADVLLRTTKEERAETLRKAKESHRAKLRRMSWKSTEIWLRFVESTQIACPSIKEADLIQLSGILASLEESTSQYGIIDRLGELGPGQLDDLHTILGEWTIEHAKTVLDELRNRMRLVKELQEKTVDSTVDEVQELQPVFEQSLWVFGPEFETIEYTSNQGMTAVIQKLFKKEMPGSKNRPDFAVVPDGSVGLYSYPEYCEETGGELGVKRLVIVELKKPTVRISTDQKDQCWKYVRELHSHGLLLPTSSVVCYPLGQFVDPVERHSRKEMNGLVTITPLDYSTVVARAKSRLHKLYDRVRNAPFLQNDEMAAFVEGAGQTQKAFF